MATDSSICNASDSKRKADNLKAELGIARKGLRRRITLSNMKKLHTRNTDSMKRKKRIKRISDHALRIQRINTALKKYGLTYTEFSKKICKVNIEDEVKHVAYLVERDPKAFESIVASAFEIPESKLIYVNQEEVKIYDLDCSIYIDTENYEDSEIIYKNVLYLSSLIGFDVLKEDPAEFGSWFKRFVLRSKDVLTSDEVVNRLYKVERAIELKNIDKVQSEVDLNLSLAISNLLTSTKDIENFACLTGSLLFAKITVSGHAEVFAQVLTQEQLRILNHNPSLIRKPFELLENIGLIEIEDNKNKLIRISKTTSSNMLAK